MNGIDRFGAALGLALLMTLQAADVPAASRPEVLNVALWQDIGTLDPHAGVVPDWLAFIGNLYEPLVDRDDTLTGRRGLLATSWEVSADGLTYTFRLRRGVRFSDGTPFDARAVRFSYDRSLALGKAPAGYLRMVRALETPDDHTVVFRLKRPHAPFLAELRFFFPVSPAAVARHEVRGDRAQGWLNEHSAGTGPYQVQRWDRGRTLVWIKNPHYWRGWQAGQFETVNLHMIYDTNTQRLMLEKGDLDVAQNISIDDLPAISRHPEIQVQQHTGTSRSLVFLNTVVGPTRDRRVRQAIAHAWNANAYNTLRRGQAPQSDGPCPLPLLGQDYALRFPYAHDPAKAGALLAQAGYPAGGFTLRFLTQKGDELKKMQFEVLQGELAKLNIRLELLEETWPAINKRLAVWGGTRDAASAVHMVGFLYGASTGHVADYLYWAFHTDASIAKGGRNLLSYSNPEVDRLVNEAMATPDETKARPLWRKANELVLEDSPALFVEKILDHIVMRRDIQGYRYLDSKLTYDYYRMTRAR